MPHVIISIQVRLDVGPTFVGDEWSDPELMKYLGANLIKQLGNNYAQYKTEMPPRLVLDRLETLGFKLVAMTGVGQTCIWTLHMEGDYTIAEQNNINSETQENQSKVPSQVQGDQESGHAVVEM